MTPTLIIHRWNDIFENSDTRKRERLKSFHAPSGCDSHGYLTLVSRFPQDKAMMAFGVFQALCQLSATLGKSVRGAFKNSDFSPMDIQQISCLLRLQECHLVAALEILTDKRVGWCAWIENETNLPTICQSPPGFVQGEGEGEGEDCKQAKREREESTSPDPDDDIPILTRKHEVPTLDAVKAYAKSAPVPISEACAEAFFDTQEAAGWITNHGHSIAVWQAALRRYASRWNENEKGRASPGIGQSAPPKPLKKLDWE